MIVKFMADKLIITFDEYNKIVEKLNNSKNLIISSFNSININ